MFVRAAVTASQYGRANGMVALDPMVPIWEPTRTVRR